MRCFGCDHVHLDGVDKPCSCGCFGFIRDARSFAREGCMNPSCTECIESGRHPVPAEAVN